ncbi:MAG: 4Fe-4S dicluster domain-containing protein [Candidatus Helarchaeota archaeon]
MGVDVSVDVEFRRKILDIHQPARLMYCYQCNHCTDDCPISKVVGSDVYNPRKLILHSLLGMKNNIIGVKENPALWSCQTCDLCDEVCPNDIELTNIFYILRNLSVKAGEAPAAYLMQAKMIFENGAAIPMTGPIERRRTQMGLSSLPQAPLDEIQTILKARGVDKVLPSE